MKKFWVRNTYWVDDANLEDGNKFNRVPMYLASQVDAAIAQAKREVWEEAANELIKPEWYGAHNGLQAFHEWCREQAAKVGT